MRVVLFWRYGVVCNFRYWERQCWVFHEKCWLVSTSYASVTFACALSNFVSVYMLSWCMWWVLVCIMDWVVLKIGSGSVLHCIFSWGNKFWGLWSLTLDLYIRDGWLSLVYHLVLVLDICIVFWWGYHRQDHLLALYDNVLKSRSWDS